jgi:hypothetical protein
MNWRIIHKTSDSLGEYPTDSNYRAKCIHIFIAALLTILIMELA